MQNKNWVTIPTHNIRDITTDNYRVYVLPDNTVVPSVTTVLSAYFDKSKYLDQWRQRIGIENAKAITNTSARRGTLLHNIVEQYLKNNVIDLSKNPIQQAMFSDIKPYLDKIDNIRGLEIPLYSKFLRVAGRCDCFAEYDNQLSIVDFKTARSPKRAEDIIDYFVQATIYAVMVYEMYQIKIDTVVILIASEFEQCQQFIRKIDNELLTTAKTACDQYDRSFIDNIKL